METLKKIKTSFFRRINKLNDIWNSILNLKYIQKIFYFLPHNFFLFLLFFVSLMLIATFDYNRYIPIYTYQGAADSFYDPILDHSLFISLNTIEEKEMEDVNKNPDQVCFLFATYGRKNNSEYKYVVHKKNQVIYEETFHSRHLEDGKFSCFALPEATRKNLGEYTIEIMPVRVDMFNTVTIFKNAKTNETAIRLVNESSVFPNKVVLVGLFILISALVNYVINKKKIKIEKFWLLLSILYILPITIINPPYEVPDEPIHFYNAYRLTQFDKNKNFYENLENQYMTMPETIGCLGYVKVQRRDKVINPEEVKECFKNANNISKKSSYVYVAPKIAFFASAIGIKLADIFTNSPGIIFYMGRIVNALVSIFIIYKALKMAPKHKELLLLIATLPMFIQQMGSYSYDAALNTFSILAVAVMLKMIYEKSIHRKLYSCLLLICGMFIYNIKLIYLPIFFLLLFIPNENYKRKIDKYLYTFAIIMGSYMLGSFSKSLIGSGDLETILSSLFTLISIGISLKFIEDEEINLKILLPIFGISLLIVAFTNTLYLFLIFFFLLFIPNQKFKKKWHKYMIILIGLLLMLLIGKVFLTLTTSETISTVSTSSSSSNKAVVKIMDLCTHPIKAMKLAYHTIRLKTVFYLRSIVGYFGWFTFHLNDLYVLAYLFLGGYILKNTTLIKTKWYDKTIAFLGILIGILGVFLAMYVHWSGAETIFIDGVQGRYFIPIIAPVLLLLSTSKKKEVNENLEKNTFSFVNIILLEYAALLLLFYY